MGYPSVTFRTELDPVTRKELELYSAQLQGFLSGAGFKSDGSFEDARFDNATLDTATIDEATVTTATITTATVTTLLNTILKFSGYGTYTVSAGDTSALQSGAGNNTENFTQWYLSAAADRTVNGIYVADLTLGLPGHVLILYNTSSKIITFDSAVVTNAKRIYGCTTPVAVPDGGAIVFIYDGVNLGWRYICSSV